MACKRPLNLSSTIFRTKPLLRTSPLLSLGKCHVSTTSKLSRKETLRQIRAKQWYAHLYTKFHTINGHTSPAFKTLLTDIATRAGYTVNENDEVAGFRCDCTENDPMILKEEAEQRRRLTKSAGDSVNEDDDDGVRETRRNWFEESEDEDGDDGNATDDEDEDGTKNRLDRYFDAVEKNANAVLERVRVLKGEEKEEEVTKPEKKHPESFNEAFLERIRVLKVEKKEHGDRPEEKYKRILIESIWWDPDDEIICSEEVDKCDDDGLGSGLWRRGDRCHRFCHCEGILKGLFLERLLRSY